LQHKTKLSKESINLHKINVQTLQIYSIKQSIDFANACIYEKTPRVDVGKQHRWVK